MRRVGAECWVLSAACALVPATGAARAFVALLIAFGLAACGGDTPTRPGPTQPAPPAPTNTAPTIDAVTTQNSRLAGPSGYIDATDILTVSATVRDQETPVEQLQYNWTATLGSFTGTGSRVQWRAPVDAAPGRVTLTLEVVERYGSNLEHRVSRSTDIELHNAVKEVGDMARLFLTKFSTTSQYRNVQEIMENFSESACPDPGEVRQERDQVENHYSNFTMHNFTVGGATVTVNFGGTCFANLEGDACVAVPVTWDSTDKRNNRRAATSGIDHLTAVYSASASRWWLCSSRFQGSSSFGHSFYNH
jgi:hypothetical protein